MRMLLVVVACAACGARQSGGNSDHCDKVPAGTVLHPDFQSEGSPEQTAGADTTPIQDGEYVAGGIRRWGMKFGASSEGSIAWVVETPTVISIGYSSSSWCGGNPRPDSGIAVKLPNTTKPIVAQRCGGTSTCQQNVP